MIEKKNLKDKMKETPIRVESIDKENMIYRCSDGNDYPLLEGSENITVEELQKCLDEAKNSVITLIENLGE